MRAGLLKERVAFLRAEEKETASGYVQKDFHTVYRCRAYRRKLAATDGVDAMEDFITQTVMLQVRRHPLMEGCDRVEYQGRAYKLVLADLQTDNTLILTCKLINE